MAQGGLLVEGIDVDLAALVDHLAVGGGEEAVILAPQDVEARLEWRADLADDD